MTSSEKKNVLDIFLWASETGEAKTVDRILVKIILHLVKHKLTVTSSSIMQMERLEVPEELFELIKKTAEELVGKPYPGGSRGEE